VPRIIPRPADIDVDILREMYRSGGVTIAGIDPRLNASRLADRLGVSRARVTSRLKEWASYGLIERYDVWPNPALVGRIGFSLDVRLADRTRKPELLERIALVEGIVGGIDFVGDYLTFQFVVRSEEEIGRTARLVAGLAGVHEVGEPVRWAELPPRRALTPLDVRILHVLRAYPTAPLATIARHVGVSSRTITTRYGRLVQDLAVWFVPVLDFRALAQPVLSLNIGLAGGEHHAPTMRALRKEYPRSLEFVRVPFGPRLPENVAVVFVLLESAARTEELETFVRGLPGVLSVELLTLIRVLGFPGTFDRVMGDAWGPAATPRAAPRAPTR
jgi:DNA-binding Lrp family transcriptional regulator